MECNIRLITLDSCRYDTAVEASTPNLDILGPLRKAETMGSFTYPAHHTFFIGNLPRIVEGSTEYLPGFDQIWRSASARETVRPIMFPFDGSTIIDYYERSDYNVQGFGGVTFFDNKNQDNMLPQLFKNFYYFGTTENLHPHERLPRTEATLPLGNIEFITERIHDEEPYFLFINSPETHIPYDVPSIKVDLRYRELITRLYREQNLKYKYDKDDLPLTSEEIDLLKSQQISALEWVDTRLGKLFSKLPSTIPTLTVVCADHGEEFGDNGRFGHAHFDETVMTVPVWVGYTE